MAIKSYNKVSTEFSMASMSDMVFLLLIFFMLSSTLISPNAIKLLLPSSTSKTMAKQTTTVYINDKFQYFVGETAATDADIKQVLEQSLVGQTEGVVVLRTDRIVPVQYVVNVIDAVNQLNEQLKTKHKVILATKLPEKAANTLEK